MHNILTGIKYIINRVQITVGGGGGEYTPGWRQRYDLISLSLWMLSGASTKYVDKIPGLFAIMWTSHFFFHFFPSTM